MARDPRSPPHENLGDAGHLSWELVLPDVPDAWRAVDGRGTRWGVRRQEDGWWRVTRWPEPEPNPQTIGFAGSLEHGQALAEERARAS